MLGLRRRELALGRRELDLGRRVLRLGGGDGPALPPGFVARGDDLERGQRGEVARGLAAVGARARSVCVDRAAVSMCTSIHGRVDQN